MKKLRLPTVLQLQIYLKSLGWRKCTPVNPNPNAIAYKGWQDIHGNPLSIILPAHKQLYDYRRRILDSIRVLSAIYCKSKTQIIAEACKKYNRRIPDTAFIMSAWGDVLVALQSVQNNSLRKIIYYGAQAGMQTFLESQGCEVQIIDWNGYKSRQEFYSDWSIISNRTAGYHDIINQILVDHDVNPHSVKCCVPNLNKPLSQAKSLKTSMQSHEWVDNLNLPKKFILIQPWSFHSTVFEDHWPFWKIFLAHLIINCDETIVYVGQQSPWPCGPYDKLIDLSDKTTNMEQVFEIANRASLVLSTSNGLSHWCNANSIPALIIANAPATFERPAWTQVLTSESLCIVPSNAAIQWAEREFIKKYNECFT